MPGIEALLAEADDARRRQLWEKSIELYHQALRSAPNHPLIFIGLGLAYEGRGRGADGRPFMLLAMERYRDAVRLNPDSEDAHERLLACATRAGKLDELIEEYQLRVRRSPEDARAIAVLNKARTLLTMQAEPAAPASSGTQQRTWLRTALLRVAPVAGVICLLAGIFLRARGPSGMAPLFSSLLIKSAALSFIAYIFGNVAYRGR